MQQLIIDVHSEKDALLIKELMKKFKTVQINTFSPDTTKIEMRNQIQQGINEANEGKVKSWKVVKNNLMKRIKTSSR